MGRFDIIWATSTLARESAMWNKAIFGALAAFAIALLVVRSARAEDEIHEGKVVSVGSSTITVLDQRDNDNDQFVVSSDTKITYNGKPAKLNEINVGDRAKVTAT